MFAIIICFNSFSDAVQTTQSHITKLYDSLEQLAEERAASLDESFKLFQLNREVIACCLFVAVVC